VFQYVFAYQLGFFPVQGWGNGFAENLLRYAALPIIVGVIVSLAPDTRLYREMARLMEVHTVWILADSRYRNVLLQPRVVGYKRHPVLHVEWLYIDLDTGTGK